jgi:hypothetical protein
MAGSVIRVVLAAWFIQLAACATLPSHRPANLTISMTRGFGKASMGGPVTEHLVLSASGESYYKIEYQGGGMISVHLEVSDSDLGDLYEILRKSHFDRITTHERRVKGRGGTDVVLEWDDVEFKVSNSGSSFVDEGWRDEWKQILIAFRAYKRKQIEGGKIDLPAAFDPALEDNFELDELEEE